MDIATYTSESDQVKLLDMMLITSNINLKYSEISTKGSTYKPHGLYGRYGWHWKFSQKIKDHFKN